MGKEKKVINILIAFFIFYKNDVKIFLIRFLTNILRSLISIVHNLLTYMLKFIIIVCSLFWICVYDLILFFEKHI